MSPYDERNDGMAKNKPIKGSANAITETKIIVRRYFLVFSADTYTASIFCCNKSSRCRISESSISILFIWGDRRDSNPQPPGPQPGTLPLSYGRHTSHAPHHNHELEIRNAFALAKLQSRTSTVCAGEFTSTIVNEIRPIIRPPPVFTFTRHSPAVTFSRREYPRYPPSLPPVIGKPNVPVFTHDCVSS